MTMDEFPEFDTLDRFLAVAPNDGYQGGDIERRFKVAIRRCLDSERALLLEYSSGAYTKLEEWAPHDDREENVSEAESRLHFYLDNEYDWTVKLDTPASKQ